MRGLTGSVKAVTVARMHTPSTWRRAHSVCAGRMLVILAMLLAALPISPLRAQEADELVYTELVAEGGTPQKFTLLGEGGFVYQSDTDLDRGGNMQVFRYDLGLAARLAL